MMRKLKALGFALAAVFAFSAVAASSAMAETTGDFHSNSGTGETTVTGEQIGANNILTITEGSETAGTPIASITCPNATYHGTFTNNTETEATLKAEFGHTEKVCPVKVGETNFGKATVHMNSCDFVISAHTDENGHAPVSIECEPEDSITITAPLGCVIHIPAQTPEDGIHFDEHETAGGKKAILATATVRKITFTATGCIGIPDHGFSDFDSEITLDGEEIGGAEEAVDIWWE